MRKLAAVLAAAVVTAAAPRAAEAFCGFYVSGADASLYNDATMVALMREGTRTVLSMQNKYQGPPEDFAMVVPVPVVLKKENVKTLSDKVFERLDQLAAPRLVEYWEQDPCYQPPRPMGGALRSRAPRAMGAVAQESSADKLGVKIEAQFEVAEYDVVVLSAKHSAGLDTWLRQNRYNIPDGAEPVLRPYVESGTKFFVAKVDVERVQFEDNQAVLSPLRFHYDSDDFALPVRLGLLNSAGKQDLLVHILARGQRYEVANYENVTIPTNITVEDEVRERFGSFYDALFGRTIEQNPGAVVTEYSWDANTCDPCPTPALRPQELNVLGTDVLSNQSPAGFVITRLHYRYGKNELGEDLVFRAAPPIAGGRGMPDAESQLQKGTQPSGRNMFQGRYAILHHWEGDIDCENPRRGRWGGPPGQGRPGPRPFPQPMPAGSALRGRAAGGGGGGAQGSGASSGSSAPISPAAVGTFVKEDIPEIAVAAGQKAAASAGGKPAPDGGAADGTDPDEAGPAASTGSGQGGTQPPPAARGDEGGCASCTVSSASIASAAVPAVFVALALLWRRRI